MTSIAISPTTYQTISRQAAVLRQPLEMYVEELLLKRVEVTEHPYVTRRVGVRGGRPISRGTRMPIWLIAAMWKSGDSPDDIHKAYPHLKLAAIYDAISYYLDHTEAIEAQITENRKEYILRDFGEMIASEL